MKKLIYSLLIGIISLFIYAGFSHNLAFDSIHDDPLFAALHSAGGQAQEISINAWGQLPKGNFTAAQLSDMAVSAMHQLGYKNGEYTLSEMEDVQHVSVRAENAQGDIHVVALVQTRKSPSKPAEGYVVVNVEINSTEAKQVANWQQELKNIIKEFGCFPHINTCLTGWLDGKLLKEEWGNRLEKAFQAANAKMVDKLQYPGFASYTGYSPAIAEYVQSGNNKVNVNMAMRYSPHDNRTYIIVGSPVITREY